MIMMAVRYEPTHWNTRPLRPTYVTITGFRDFLPDSGATSHFTGHYEDIQNPQSCDIEVTIADGNVVRATHVGRADINFITDRGTPSTLELANIYYIPGLSRRLFSLQSFTRDTPFSVEITHHYTRLNFGDGEFYTWPLTRNDNDIDRYAMNASDNDSAPSKHKTIEPISTRPIALEKGMTRLGFRAAKGLLAGSLHRVWADCHIQAGTDPYCWSARLAISRVAPRNLRRPAVYYPKKAFEMLFADIIPNPHRDTLTLGTAYDGHLLLVCPFSNYVYWRGMNVINSATIIQAIETFRTHTVSKGATVSLQYIRADAASYFTSREFIAWGIANNTKISIAAPNHQEMNSIVERQWQNMNQIMRAILIHARLSNHFYHYAGQYAADILNVLPAKNLLDHNGNPCTPHFKALRVKPKIGNFRVFGCPASFKRYNATSRRTQTQQASRGIFIGFPTNQAGWLFYMETRIGSSHIHVSRDATFDETFDSALVFDKHPFQGSLALRRTPAATDLESFNEQQPQHSTGSITNSTHVLPEHHNSEVEDPESILDPLETNALDKPDPELETIIDPRDSNEQTPRYPQRICRQNPLYIENSRKKDQVDETAMYVTEKISYDPTDERVHSSHERFKRHHLHDFAAAYSAIQKEAKEPVDLYLPEPNGLKAILRLPPKQREAWLKAYRLELKNLIIDNQTFAKETPQPGDKVIPTKPVARAKQTHDGYLDKLKMREVARGDLERRDEMSKT